LPQVVHLPMRSNQKPFQGLLQQWGQPHNPFIGLRLIKAKEEALDGLNGVQPKIDQDKKELQFWAR
jgi:hypothetical protein